MKIVLITQDEPFYLAEHLKYFLSKLPEHSLVSGCVVLSPSPFGKRKSFIQKAMETRDIFGNRFFIYYTFKYLFSKFSFSKSVKRVLKKYRIAPIYLEKTINHNDSLDKIKRFEPDLLISILGNEIFKKPIIELAPKGCLNLHTALLPKYRGLMPTFWVLKNNETETGVSVFFVDDGIDSGEILVQKKLKISENCTQARLIQTTKRMGMDAILKAINLIHEGNYKLKENSDNEATYFSMPTRKDVNEFLATGKRFF